MADKAIETKQSPSLKIIAFATSIIALILLYNQFASWRMQSCRGLASEVRAGMVVLDSRWSFSSGCEILLGFSADNVDWTEAWLVESIYVDKK